VFVLFPAAPLARTFDVDRVRARGNLFRMLDFRFVVMIEKRRKASVDERAKVVSAVTVVNATSE